MKRLSGKEVRSIARTVLRHLNRVYRDSFERAVGIGDIDEVIAHMYQQGELGAEAARKHLVEPLALAKASTACIGLLALSLHRDEETEQLFVCDWLNVSGRPNPNHILQCMLTQLANFALSSILLLERGLDNPARAINRLATELSQQILVLTHSRDDFKAYVAAQDEKSAMQLWSALFGRGKLNMRLGQIEQELGFDEDMVENLSRSRKENYAFYSQAVHHSFVASTIGAYAPKFEGSSQSLGVFGGENANTRSTLRHLNFTLWYFVLGFFGIIGKYYRITPKNPKDLFWLEAFMLYFCVREGYLHLYTGQNAGSETASDLPPESGADTN